MHDFSSWPRESSYDLTDHNGKIRSIARVQPPICGRTPTLRTMHVSRGRSLPWSYSIKLSQLAEQKATNPAVKAFAQKMVAEHNKMSMNMQPFVASWGDGRKVSCRRA
jgi:hypothetical protein